jgi:hypothetical protein
MEPPIARLAPPGPFSAAGGVERQARRDDHAHRAEGRERLPHVAHGGSPHADLDHPVARPTAWRRPFAAPASSRPT